MKKLLLAVLLLTGIASFGQGTTTTERAQEIGVRIHALVDSLVNVGWGSVSGVATSYGWYRPEDYGYTDTTTDAGAAGNAMMAAMPIRGGVIVMGAKDYKFTTKWVINKPCTIIGGGQADYFVQNAPTRLFTRSATLDMIEVAQAYVTIKDVSIENKSATTPTAGSGIFVSSAQSIADGYIVTTEYKTGFTFENLTVSGFYDNIHVKNSYIWNIDNLHSYSAVNAGLYIANETLPDGGDMNVTNSFFFAMTRNTTYGIYQASSGGGKFANNKFNSSALGNFKLQYGYYGNVSGSSIALFSNNSFENYAVAGIYTSNFDLININGNQFSAYSSGSGNPAAININNANGVSAMGNVIRLWSSNERGVIVGGSNNVTIGNAYDATVGTKWLLSSNTNLLNLNNVVAADTTAPLVSTATAIDANTIRVAFNEPVNTAVSAGWSFSNGSALTITGVTAVNSSTWDFTVSQTMTSGQTITRTYNSGTGNTLDAAGNELVAFTSQSVTNSISGGSALFADNFTTNGGLVGYNNWAQLVGTTDASISGNVVTFGTVGTEQIYYNTTSAINPIQNGRITADLTLDANGTGMAFSFRTVDANNGYIMLLSASGASTNQIIATLYKKVSGTYTSVGVTPIYAYSPSATRAIEITFNGSTFTLKVGSNATYTFPTDATFTAAGKVGFRNDATGTKTISAYSVYAN